MNKHPLASLVEAARAGGLDFFIIIGGDPAIRKKMGLPTEVLDEQPLLLGFQASYHEHSKPVGDEHGLNCELSFDALYHCRIPWSSVKRLVVQYDGDEQWPAAWGEANPRLEPEEEPPPDNIRQFPSRSKKKRD